MKLNKTYSKDIYYITKDFYSLKKMGKKLKKWSLIKEMQPWRA